MADRDQPSPRALRTLGTFTVPPLPPAGRVPYGPPEAPPPAPLAFLAPWLEGAVDAMRGGLWGSEGAGDTAAAKTAELLSAGLPLLPLKALGFFSRVDKAVDLIPAKGAHPNKVASLLKSNASAEELAYRNVPQFLAGKGNATVTRADLAAHLAAHPAPVPTTVTRGAVPAHLVAEQADLSSRAAAAFDKAFPSATTHGQPWPGARLSQLEDMNARHWAWQAAGGDEAAMTKLKRLPISDEHRAAILDYGRLANESRVLNETRLTAHPPAKYAQYTVPGGEEYRETLLTLPEQPPQALPPGYSIQPLVGDRHGAKFTLEGPDGTGVVLLGSTAEQAHAGALNHLQRQGMLPLPANFHSGHFEEPNVLVHTRANDRTLPTGERGRFVEEVQSDWHQRGKTEGYRQAGMEYTAFYRTPTGAQVPLGQGPTAEAALAAVEPGWKTMPVTIEVQAVPAVTNPYGVADAPFKEAWPDLGLKQQVLEAAEDPSAQWIGFTAGGTQADRYNLSKQIDRLKVTEGNYEGLPGHTRPSYSGEGYEINAWKDGKQVIDAKRIPRDQLAAAVGKEMAAKIIEDLAVAKKRPVPKFSHEYSQMDLQVGGEGMRHFYDQVLPKRLEKIVKPFGGTVERGTLGGRTRAEIDAEMDALHAAPWTNHTTAEMNRLQAERNAALTVEAEMWFARLTPEMKARILKEGLPLLSLLPLGVLGNYGQQPQEPAR